MFWENIIKKKEHLDIRDPILPRQSKPPKKFDEPDTYQQYVFGPPSANINLYPFSHQNINFSKVTMQFLTSTHIHIFFTRFNRKNLPKNRYTRKQPTHFSITP